MSEQGIDWFGRAFIGAIVALAVGLGLLGFHYDKGRCIRQESAGFKWGSARVQTNTGFLGGSSSIAVYELGYPGTYEKSGDACVYWSMTTEAHYNLKMYGITAKEN